MASLASRQRMQLSWLATNAAKRTASALLLLLAAARFSYIVASAWPNDFAYGYDLSQVVLAGHVLLGGRNMYAVSTFTYPPSAALLVGAPLAQVSYLIVFRVALVLAVLLLGGMVVVSARIVGRPATALATTAGIAILAASSSVKEVIGLENVSLFVGLLGAIAFLLWSQGREVAAGWLFGLTLAIKPLLAPLVLGLVVLRRWRCLLPALALPAVLNLVALAIDPAALQGMLHTAHVYLSQSGISQSGAFGRDFLVFNSALSSIGQLLTWPGALTVGLRVLVAGTAATGAVIVWRTRPDPFRSLEAGGLIIAGYYLTSSVLENHWLLVLLPFAYAAVDRRSPVANWPVALGAFFAADLFVLPHWLVGLDYWPSQAVTVGLGLALVVVATAAAAVRQVAEARGRPGVVVARRFGGEPAAPAGS